MQQFAERPLPDNVESLRVPPHSIEAEQAVLGGLMLSGQAWDRVADKLGEEDFYRREHQLIFRAIGELSGKNMPCDAVTLGEWFEHNGTADLVGGIAYVVELANATPSAANIEAYAQIVREKSVLRQLIDAGTEIAGDGFNPKGRSTPELIESAEKKVFRIAESGSRGSRQFVRVTEAAREAVQLLHDRAGSNNPITGLATGFTDFDTMTSGLQPGDLVILAARPSMGKCLAHDAELVLEDGSVRTIEQIVARRSGQLLSLNDRYRLEPAQIGDFIDDGRKPVFEVTTRLGRRVVTTLSHPFLTVDGWKPLAELATGQPVAVPRQLPVFGRERMRECEVKLLAYLIGDGGLTGSVPRFTNTNPSIIEDFAAAVGQFGGVRLSQCERRVDHASSWRVVGDADAAKHGRERFAATMRDGMARAGVTPAALARSVGASPAAVSHWVHAASMPKPATARQIARTLAIEPDEGKAHERMSRNPVTSWLIGLGLMGCDAQGKRLPDPVFRLVREQIALFLNRLFATDGWATVLRSGQPQVGYASVSETLVRQVQHLLLRLGIVAAIRQRWVRYRDARRACWQLDITHHQALRRFVDEIGIHGKEPAVEAVRQALATRRPQGNRDLVPIEVWHRIEQAKGEMSWSELARRAGMAESNPHPHRRALSRDRLARLAMVLDAPDLADLASSDVYWDRIVSIVPLGEQQVYDLTIPGNHNFVANDVCVHNTALSVNMAEYAAIREKKSVAIFSMEMSAVQLTFRLLSSLGRINQQNLRSGKLEDEEWPRVTQAIALLADAKIFIDDTPGLSPTELRARARRLKRSNDLGLIVIDYLQLMAVPGNKENRATEISEISRSLKALAKELAVPVIALSQLNRSLEQRTDKRPQMSDLRESGAIEQDADLIVFIYRDEYYNKESADKGVAEIIIGKQRNGPTGMVKLTFRGQYTKFENHVGEDGGYY